MAGRLARCEGSNPRRSGSQISGVTSVDWGPGTGTDGPAAARPAATAAQAGTAAQIARQLKDQAEIDAIEEPSPDDKKPNKALVFGIAACCIGGVTAVFWPFLSPALRHHCLPFVPATTVQIENVLNALRLRAPGNMSKLVDLGSGDGRIVIAAAKEGYAGTGVELNTWLNLYARFTAATGGVSSKATFETTDLWKVPYKNYDAVVIFGVAEMMGELSVSLQQQLRPGSRIIACRFAIPDMKPAHTVGEGFDTTWVYHIDENTAENAAAARKAGETAPVHPSSPITGTSGTAREGKWKCGVCTSESAEMSTVCEVCGIPR